MTRTIDRLPPLLGYAELEEKYGWLPRTIQRWVRAGKMPRPMTVPSGEKAWLLADIEAFIDSLRPGLVAAAVTDPSKLNPAQLVPTMRELGARLVQDTFGETVTPDTIGIHIVRQASEEEVIDCRARFLERLEELCGHFGYQRALHIAASIFPAIRAELSVDGKFSAFRDADQLREFCVAALDDEQWADLEKAIAALEAQAASRQGRRPGP